GASAAGRVRAGAERAAGGARRLEELLGSRRQDSLEARVATVSELVVGIDALIAGTAEARDAVGERAAALERRTLEAGDAEDVTAQLRACSAAEAELQTRLHSTGDSVTESEVTAAHLRDRRDEAAAELGRIAEQLGRDIESATGQLGDPEREEIERKLERLARRRESLGPVNPLAEREYSEAVDHVNELQEQRAAPDTALSDRQALSTDTGRALNAAVE